MATMALVAGLQRGAESVLPGPDAVDGVPQRRVRLLPLHLPQRHPHVHGAGGDPEGKHLLRHRCRHHHQGGSQGVQSDEEYRVWIPVGSEDKPGMKKRVGDFSFIGFM